MTTNTHTRPAFDTILLVPSFTLRSFSVKWSLNGIQLHQSDLSLGVQGWVMKCRELAAGKTLPVTWLPAGRGELRWPCCCLELVKCWCISKWHRSGLGADTPSGYFPVKGVELFLQCYRIPAPPLPHEARGGQEREGPNAVELRDTRAIAARKHFSSLGTPRINCHC